MPKIAELKQFGGTGPMWARLDIDWDGGSVSIYTPHEIAQIKEEVKKDIIEAIQKLDRITYEDY